VRPYNKDERDICAKEEKDISAVKGGEMQEFINKQLRKGYIRPLKLSQTAPMFFVGNKDGKKYILQDYQYLNEWTIKNNYSLPLISDIVESMGTKKVFTKLDLQWGYNNI